MSRSVWLHAFLQVTRVARSARVRRTPWLGVTVAATVAAITDDPGAESTVSAERGNSGPGLAARARGFSGSRIARRRPSLRLEGPPYLSGTRYLGRNARAYVTP